MKMYIQFDVKANNQGFQTEMELETFEEETGICIDLEDDEIDEFTESEIKEYALSHWSEDRYEMGVDEDTKIVFTGYRILPEGHDDLMHTHMNEE